MNKILITEDFVEKILHNFKLNKEQCKILNIDFPLIENWEVSILGKEILITEAELLILLRGDLSIKNQQQVSKNYSFLKETILINEESILDEKKNLKSYTNNKLEIYTDGACKNNPGEAGSGIIVYEGENKPKLFFGNYDSFGTNNTAELNALLYGLKLANSHDSEVIIYSDSKYAIDCISNWSYKWKENNWTKKGGEIKNLELIKEGHFLFENMKDRIRLEHVKGHSGIEGNELSDRMAVYAIKTKEVNYTEYIYDDIYEILKMESY
ncbi:hypothetical protein GCM10012288_13750 [Malaciobacter pacificus]|uniref:ribonuclease H n=1 Tax=Malaciobacter pacificus TaxID=1080223 RepID=A0A5C2HDE2_9BACT|nr:ribonuclease H family protein [Malaciobacter pacificus]QEP34854.1 ribonuclease HI [Malaciobacter pacificus]GGD40932.1 hypothetical protein GCM10012288_13750 [Malaciobacter pacificus]